MDASLVAKIVLDLIAVMILVSGIVAIFFGFKTDIIETYAPKIDDMSKFMISVGIFLCVIAAIMATATYFA